VISGHGKKIAISMKGVNRLAPNNFGEPEGRDIVSFVYGCTTGL